MQRFTETKTFAYTVFVHGLNFASYLLIYDPIASYLVKKICDRNTELYEPSIHQIYEIKSIKTHL